MFLVSYIPFWEGTCNDRSFSSRYTFQSCYPATQSFHRCTVTYLTAGRSILSILTPPSLPPNWSDHKAPRRNTLFYNLWCISNTLLAVLIFIQSTLLLQVVRVLVGSAKQRGWQQQILSYCGDHYLVSSRSENLQVSFLTGEEYQPRSKITKAWWKLNQICKREQP